MKSGKKYKVPISCGVEYNGDLYFASVVGNDLFKYDIRTNELTYVLSFDKEKDSSYLYRCAKLYKNQAWFIPQCADNIAVVNLDTLDIEYIEIQFRWIENNIELKCCAAGVYKQNYLFVVPYDIDSLITINMQTKEQKVYYDVGSHNRKYIDAFYYNEKLYCIPWTAQKILEININNGERRTYEWPFNDRQYSSVLLDNVNKNIWFVPAKSEDILTYNMDNKKFQKMTYKHNEISESYINSINSKIVNNKIYMFPYNADNIMQIDRENNKMIKYFSANLGKKIHFCKLIDSKDLYFIIEGEDKIYHFIDEENLLEERTPRLVLSESFIKTIDKKLKNKMMNKIIIQEMDYIKLDEMLNVLRQNNN